MTELSPDLLLKAYACGVFPMAETRDSKELFWVDPKRRGILPLDEFHLPRRLAKTVKRGVFRVSINTAFEGVMRGCAAAQPTRPDTWINESILKHYGHLHRLGHAHSVECWLKNKLVGGLYGVSLGGAFFGESMFHTVTDASKVALAHLVARLKAGGYTLLDTQFVTEHLQQFGAREIDRELYHKMLDTALMRQADFYSLPPGLSGEAVLQSITQMS